MIDSKTILNISCWLVFHYVFIVCICFGELFSFEALNGGYLDLFPSVRRVEASAIEAAKHYNAGGTVPQYPVETGVSQEYLVPQPPSLQCTYFDQRVEPLRAKLLYFFIQARTPEAPDAPSGTIVRIAPTLQKSRARVLEVTYDRGTVADELAREASRMSAASERLLSFEDTYSSNKFVCALCSTVYT